MAHAQSALAAYDQRLNLLSDKVTDAQRRELEHRLAQLDEDRDEQRQQGRHSARTQLDEQKLDTDQP